MDYSNLNIRIPKELHQRLKDTCYQRRDSITEVLTKAINDYLNEDNERNENNESAATQVSCDRADDINQLKETNAQLEQRLAKLENTLQTIDHEGLSALLTASNTIEHGRYIVDSDV